MNRTNSANNGAEEFSDFQSSGPATTAASGETGSGGMTNGGTGSAPGGITNPKWRDVSSLVDLGGLSSNTDKKVGIRKVWVAYVLRMGGMIVTEGTGGV